MGYLFSTFRYLQDDLIIILCPTLVAKNWAMAELIYNTRYLSELHVVKQMNSVKL